MSVLIYPRFLFRRTLRTLLSSPRQPVLVRLGRCDLAGSRSWLARDLVEPSSIAGSRPSRDQCLRVRLISEPPLSGAEPDSGNLMGELYIGNENLRGQVWGSVGGPAEADRLDELRLPGPGMPVLPFVTIASAESARFETAIKELPASGWPSPTADTAGARRVQSKPVVSNHRAEAPAEPAEFDSWLDGGHRSRPWRSASGSRILFPHKARADRWSRTIGALGGAAIWRRLTDLKAVIIGCGRSGSLLASALASLGLKWLGLVDGDRLEPHNLAEMDLVTERELGAPKAEALARALESQYPDQGEFLPVAHPANSPEGLALLKQADVIGTCVDNDAGRLAAGIIATLYHKVLLEVGTGIQFETRLSNRGDPNGRQMNGEKADEVPADVSAHSSAAPARIMGADLRLIMPGDGCLLCRGNLTNYLGAVEELCSGRAPGETALPWFEQRAGSLRSLNQIAVGLLVQLLQDAVTERIERSTWIHLDCDPAGHFSLTYPALQSSSNCALCAKAGAGDGGIRW